MNAYDILTGKAGNSIKALTLSALNFELGRLLVGHQMLKQPVIEQDRSPDQFRDLIRLPEMEAAKVEPLDAELICNGIIATCAMAFDLARMSDFNERGGLIHPHAWLVDRVRTPIETVRSHFDWRTDQAAKLAQEQAAMIGLSDKAEAIGAAAKARAEHDQRSKAEYALAEVESMMNPSIMKSDESDLIDLLMELENAGAISSIVKVAANAAHSSIDRTKSRLMAGQFARVDEEVVLFAQTH